jgi:hypothetical protein
MTQRIPQKRGTVKQYLAGLPLERRRELLKVRAAILRKIPKGYVESYRWGMITYEVPLKLYESGYLGRGDTPLPFVCLAAQKQHFALYLTIFTFNESSRNVRELLQWFKRAYRATGKKLKLGRSCLRFKAVDDLPLNLIGALVAKVPLRKYTQWASYTRRLV